MGTKLLVNTTHVYTENEINSRRSRDVRNIPPTTPKMHGNAGSPKMYDYVGFQTILYLSFIQQLRTNTDITSYELGKKAVDHLEDSLHNTLSNMEKDFNDVTKSLLTSTTTRAHEGESNIYNIVMASLSKVVPEMLTNTSNIRFHLYLIQQIRINTDITSHKLGKESLNYLDDVLHSTLLDMEYRLEDLE